MVHNRSMAKSKLLFSSLNILIVCSILEAWQIAIGIRLGVYMLFGLLFLSIFFAYVIHNKHFEFAIDRAVIDLIYLYLGIYLISVITFVGIIIYSSNHPVFFTDALDQFSKFIINDTFQLILFFSVAIFFSLLSSEKRIQVFKVFIFSIFASCVYQYISIFSLMFLDTDLDKLIWSNISYGASEGDIVSTIEGQGLGQNQFTFYRGGGFAINPNVLASQIVLILPFLLVYAGEKQREYILFFMIAFGSLFFTLSRSGMLAFLFCFLTFFLLYRKNIFKKFKGLIFFFFSFLFVLIFNFFDDIYMLLSYRFNLEGNFIGNIISNLSTRSALNDAAGEMVAQSPILGLGSNTSSSALLGYPKILMMTGNNLHNFWSVLLVEEGILGLATNLLFYIYIIYVLIKRPNIFSVCLISSIVGLMISGFFNSFLTNFSTQLFILIMFLTAVLHSTERNNIDMQIKNH